MTSEGLFDLVLARLRRALVRLRNTVRPAPAESELTRELTAHLGLLEDEYIRRGLTGDAARLAARRSFGGVEQAKERQRDSRSYRWLDDLLRDGRQGARLLRRSPLFTATAALSIGIGIGATTAVFTVANALLFHPPAGVVEPGRVVDIGTTQSGRGFGPASYPNYLDIRQRTTTLDHVYALPLFPQAMSLSTGNREIAERVFLTPVTVNYFTALGTLPAAGRLFDQRDRDDPGASPLLVLSHSFWTTRFNRDPAIIGRALTVNGHAVTVIGVASEGFHGTGIRSGDGWVPIGMGGMTGTNRGGSWLMMGGRLKPSVTLPQVLAELETVGQALQREFPDENKAQGLTAAVLSPAPGNTGVIAAFLLLLTAIVLAVLAIACANVVGVLLARAAARRVEFAVRVALGAARWRLVRQLLIETMLLFALGGVLGLAIARTATSLTIAALPRLPFPIELSLAVDYRVVLFTTALVMFAALLSGLIPALHSSKAGVAATLKDEAHATPRQRLRHLFVTAQIAFSILLVAVGGLFLRSLQLAGSSNPGFDPHGVEIASLDLSQASYNSTSGLLFTRTLLDDVRRLPSVESASAAVVLPGGFETRENAVQVAGVTPPNGEQGFGVDWNMVTPGYFATLKIPLLAGRDFTDADRAGTPDVVIVGQGIAKQFWPGQDPIGKYLVQPTWGGGGARPPIRSLRVVGVVGDVKASSLIDGLAQSLVYVPLDQQFSLRVIIVARQRPGQRSSEALHQAITRLNPNLAADTQTLDEYSALGFMPQRIASSLAGGLGLIGLLLAAIGIYGVTAYIVTSRTREFGIRLALGAPRSNVLGIVVGQGLVVTVLGCVAGLALAALAGRVLTAFLFGASPLDPLMFSGAAALFVAVGLAACLLPAFRASLIDPLEALRSE